MILRLTTVHENSARRAGACPGLADASVGPTICAAVIFMAGRNNTSPVIPIPQPRERNPALIICKTGRDSSPAAAGSE